MRAFTRSALIICALTATIATAGCNGAVPSPYGSDQGETPAQQPAEQPSGEDLFAEITDAQYQSWAPAPNYETRKPATGPHGDEVQIFLNPTAAQTAGTGASEWPVGSVIVKDIYQSGALVQIAAGKKTADGWYWGEWDTEGATVVEGLMAEPCQSCHTANGTDGILAVQLQ